MSGLLIAAPSSGSGKTTVTLGLMRALRDRGIAVAPGKAGPDYIDPAFHAAASGRACFNYDPWAMRPELLRANAAMQAAGGEALIVEAMMGLFDGAVDGTGSPPIWRHCLGSRLFWSLIAPGCRNPLPPLCAAMQPIAMIFMWPALSSTRLVAIVMK